MLHRSRQFFADRNILEVDCPALSQAASIDTHIDLIQAVSSGKGIGYLNPSYEYGMKRLLAMGSGDIYQIGHVFRDGEIGPLHNPEFTMTEWYRIGYSFEQMIQETLDYIRLFLGEHPVQTATYRTALIDYLSCDYIEATPSDLHALAQRYQLDLPPESSSWDKDTFLQLLFSFLIEPRLPSNHYFVLTHFPASQAALAQIATLADGEKTGLRFEIYFQGIELANGYHELTDPREQRNRFKRSQEARLSIGKAPLPIDEHFLSALKKGLPDCCGVAVGFDRLMLLKHKAQTLEAVLPFTWNKN